MTALATMLVGGLLYVLFRRESLVMFGWFDSLGLGETIRSAREFVQPLKPHMPGTLIYSLPNALWYFSGLLAFSAIWDKGVQRTIWSLTFSAFAFGAELGQYFHIVPGTYQHSDMVLMTAAFITFIALEGRNKEAKTHEEQH